MANYSKISAIVSLLDNTDFYYTELPTINSNILYDVIRINSLTIISSEDIETLDDNFLKLLKLVKNSLFNGNVDIYIDDSIGDIYLNPNLINVQILKVEYINNDISLKNLNNEYIIDDSLKEKIKDSKATSVVWKISLSSENTNFTLNFAENYKFYVNKDIDGNVNGLEVNLNGQNPEYLNFHIFCDSWNNYKMYKYIDTLTFLKGGNYIFKCYDSNDNEVKGTIKLLPADHELFLYDKNILISSGTSVNLNNFLLDRTSYSEWLSKESIKKYNDEQIKSITEYWNELRKTGPVNKLLDSLKDIYNTLNLSTNICEGKIRDYDSDYANITKLENSSETTTNLPSKSKHVGSLMTYNSVNDYIWYNNTELTYESIINDKQIKLIFNSLYEDSCILTFEKTKQVNTEGEIVTVILLYKEQEYNYTTTIYYDEDYVYIEDIYIVPISTQTIIQREYNPIQYTLGSATLKEFGFTMNNSITSGTTTLYKTDNTEDKEYLTYLMQYTGDSILFRLKFSSFYRDLLETDRTHILFELPVGSFNNDGVFTSDQDCIKVTVEHFKLVNSEYLTSTYTTGQYKLVSTKETYSPLYVYVYIPNIPLNFGKEVENTILLANSYALNRALSVNYESNDEVYFETLGLNEEWNDVISTTLNKKYSYATNYDDIADVLDSFTISLESDSKLILYYKDLYDELFDNLENPWYLSYSDSDEAYELPHDFIKMTYDLESKTYKNVRIPIISKYINITDDIKYMNVGEEHLINIVVIPNNDISLINWESSNSDCISVDNQGKLIAKSVGTSVITASLNNISTNHTITVVENLEAVEDIKIKFESDVIDLFVGDTKLIKATVYDSNNLIISNIDITWAIDNNPELIYEVIELDENGNITGLAVGEAKVIAYAGTTQSECKIIVNTTKDKIMSILKDSVNYKTNLLRQLYNNGIMYELSKRIDNNIDPENDWIGEIRFTPDNIDDYNLDLSLSIISIDNENQIDQISYYNNKNEYVYCDYADTLYLGSNDSNLKTAIEKGINLSFYANYISPYYVSTDSISKSITYLRPLLHSVDNLDNYNLDYDDDKKILYFLYVCGVCEEDPINKNSKLHVHLWGNYSNGNYSDMKRENYYYASSEGDVSIEKQEKAKDGAPNGPTGEIKGLIPVFLYKTGDDKQAKSSVTANGYNVSVLNEDSTINKNTETSLGYTQEPNESDSTWTKIYPGSIWNKSIKDWLGLYLGALTNLYVLDTSEKIDKPVNYINNYVYYQSYSTTFTKDVLVTVRPRYIDDCNRYINIRDINYVEWLQTLLEYRSNGQYNDYNINISLDGDVKNFPIVFNFNYKLPNINVSVPNLDSAIVLKDIYGNEKLINTNVLEDILYSLDGNGDPINVINHPKVPKCSADHFSISTDNKIIYTSTKPTQTANITDLVIHNTLDTSGKITIKNHSKYDIVTTLYKKGWGKLKDEALTDLQLNCGFIE